MTYSYASLLSKFMLQIMLKPEIKWIAGCIMLGLHNFNMDAIETLLEMSG